MAFTTAEARAVHCEAGIPVTVVCDRWQPPYEFRNARPQEVGERLDHLEVVRLEVLLSHRYTTDEAWQLTMGVRGEAAPEPAATETNDVGVVLARWWSRLWEGAGMGAPNLIRPVQGQTDAVLTLPLDDVLHKHLRCSWPSPLYLW